MRSLKRVITLLAALLLLCALTAPASANSAEPPGLTVIVAGAPEGLRLALTWPEGDSAELRIQRKAWETYYRFHYHDAPREQRGDELLKNASLLVEGGGVNLLLPLPAEEMRLYNNLLTLDLGKGTLEPGQKPLRVPLLVALRVVLTLIIEGAVFYLFGYRARRSWLVFLIANLLTQTLLNAVLTGPDIGSYWMLTLIFLEVLVFITELIAYCLLLREHDKFRAAFAALAANLASLVLGGLLIGYLPV